MTTRPADHTRIESGTETARAKCRMKTALKTTLPITVLLLLAGCGDVEYLTQPQSQTQDTPSVTPSPGPSAATTEQSATEIPGEFTGKVVKVPERLTTFRVLICKMAIGTAAAERLLIQWNSESNPSNKPLATRCYLSSPGQIWSLPCMQTAYSLGRALYTGLRIRIKHLRRHPSQNLPPRLYHLIEPHVPGDSSVPPDHEDTCGRPWSNPWRTMSKRHV